MFWAGFIAGFIIGGFLGILIISCLIVGKRADEEIEDARCTMQDK